MRDSDKGEYYGYSNMKFYVLHTIKEYNDIIMKILLLFIYAINFTYCTETSDERLFVTEKNGLFGYVCGSDDTIVPCIYHFAYTDTISQIGFVTEENGKIACIEKKGNKLFYVFKYDNGPDYPQEGLFRIINEDGLIGFADTLGKVIIPPTYKFAFPFENGKAKETNEGRLVNKGEYSVWESSSWMFIDNPLIKKNK